VKLKDISTYAPHARRKLGAILIQKYEVSLPVRGRCKTFRSFVLKHEAKLTHIVVLGMRLRAVELSSTVIDLTESTTSMSVVTQATKTTRGNYNE